jgi:uncharacterized protein
MRTITLEEHFASPGFLDGFGRELKEQALRFGGADKRLAEMDAAGIDMQVLSLTSPGAEQLEAADAIALARDSNDYLAEAVKRHPVRFGGFASLPTAAPDKAAEELERRVREQKFAGAMINGHHRGHYLDDKFFWPILEFAEKLGVPIYLHPTQPPRTVIEASYGGFSPIVTDMLASTASCSPPTIHTNPWRRRRPFWNSFPSAPRIGSARAWECRAATQVEGC